jgi:hypothetical protein
MAEIVNLRAARKRAKRKQDENRAAAQRAAHGSSKTSRQEFTARRDKAVRDLDAHRIDKDEP